jgi:predicted nucleic acid-binding protein
MTDQVWVVNASPLILMGKLDQLDLIQRLSARLIVPSAVIQEIGAGVCDTATRKTIDWATRFVVPDQEVPASILSWDVGAGESQVLTHCLSSGGLAILDDGAARAAAKALQIQLTGSLGIILRAKKSGIISAARPLIDQLVASGSYLSTSLISAALLKVNES